MSTFQIVTLPLLVALAAGTALAAARRRIAFRPAFAWMLLWIAAAIAIAAPDVLVQIAHLLGIGRGADLVLYLSILFMFVAVFLSYLRFRRLEEQMTRIVRHLAIREAEAEARAEEKR
jgi:hypothetical protein